MDRKGQLVIFDLDGTLLDTIADLGNAVNHMLNGRNLPIHSLNEYNLMVGRGMRNLVKDALPEDLRNDESVDSALEEFLDYYLEHIDLYTLPYPGIKETVIRLHETGYLLAIASNKLQKGTEKLISEFFPGIPFVAVCGNSPIFPLKPDAALVKYIMGKAGVRAQDTTMIGDSEIDILTAKNAGIRSIGVSWGFRSLEDIKNADIIVSKPEEIPDALLSN